MLDEIKKAYRGSLWARSGGPEHRIFMAEDEGDLSLWGRRDELRDARAVQQSLLPLRTPLVAGFEIEASSTPALEVGGDHYNFFWVGGDRIGVLIADVSGKGMPAALVATMLRATFRTLAYGNPDVRDVLSRVNAWMGKSLRTGMFITCSYGILDIASRRLTWARAGHEPLLIARRGDACRGASSAATSARASTASAIEVLAPCGIALGVVSGSEFREATEVQSVELRAGDRLLLFTDGLSEAMSESDEEFGMARILLAWSQPNPLLALDRALSRHVGAAPLADDLTFVSIAVQDAVLNPTLNGEAEAAAKSSKGAHKGAHLEA